MWFYGAIIKRGKTDDERKHDRPTPQLVNWTVENRTRAFDNHYYYRYLPTYTMLAVHNRTHIIIIIYYTLYYYNVVIVIIYLP